MVSNYILAFTFDNLFLRFVATLHVPLDSKKRNIVLQCIKPSIAFKH